MELGRGDRYMMASEWRFTNPEPENGSLRDYWQTFFGQAAADRAPELRFMGMLEAWACPGDMGRTWLFSVHASESSVDEGIAAWRTTTSACSFGPDLLRVGRSFSGPLVDVVHEDQEYPLQRLDLDSSVDKGDRWLMLTRWRLRPGPAETGNAGDSLRHQLNSFFRPRSGAQRPLVAWVADSGDETIAFVSLFTSSAALEAAWDDIRQPGAIRDVMEHQLIMTDFISGQVIDLFGLADQALLTEFADLNALAAS